MNFNFYGNKMTLRLYQIFFQLLIRFTHSFWRIKSWQHKTMSEQNWSERRKKQHQPFAHQKFIKTKVRHRKWLVCQIGSSSEVDDGNSSTSRHISTKKKTVCFHCNTGWPTKPKQLYHKKTSSAISDNLQIGQNMSFFSYILSPKLYKEYGDGPTQVCVVFRVLCSCQNVKIGRSFWRVDIFM